MALAGRVELGLAIVYFTSLALIVTALKKGHWFAAGIRWLDD